MTVKKKYSVLIADDAVEDRSLLRRAIEEITPRLQVVGEVENGEQAIANLAGTGPYQNRERHPFPDLLLIDLMMPLKTGFEVLEWLQSQPGMKPKVAVLSGSLEDTTHRQRVLRLGVQHFYSKHISYEELLSSVRIMQEELEMEMLEFQP